MWYVYATRGGGVLCLFSYILRLPLWRSGEVDLPSPNIHTVNIG